MIADGATPRMVAEFAKRRQQLIRDLNRIPGFRCQSPQGAFYAWVNIADTGMTAEELCRIMLEEAGVAAIPGAAFGPAGRDFIRFSFASSSQTCKRRSREFSAPPSPGSKVWRGRPRPRGWRYVAGSVGTAN